MGKVVFTVMQLGVVVEGGGLIGWRVVGEADGWLDDGWRSNCGGAIVVMDMVAMLSTLGALQVDRISVLVLVFMIIMYTLFLVLIVLVIECVIDILSCMFMCIAARS